MNEKDKHLKLQVYENATTLKLIQKDFQHMKDGIDQIKKDLKNLREDLVNGFVTKIEFKDLKDEVDELRSLKNWAIKIVIGAIIAALLSVIGIRSL